MPKPFDFGGVNLTAGEDSSDARPSEDTPFCIAILGDFSGRANRGIHDPQAIGKRRAVLVDRDNFDDVLSRAGAEIRLPVGDSGELTLRFSELDDFHPDHLFQSLEIFGKLRDLRGRLQDDSTFAAAANELGLGLPEAVPRRSDTAPVAAPSAARSASGSLLDQMIEQTEARAATEPPRRAPDEVSEFARRVVAQHLVGSPDPRQPEILAVVDRAISGLMRAILHNPELQALEAAWRALFLLVRQLETGSQLKLYLFDISKQELEADLTSPDLRNTGAYRLLVEQSVGTQGAEPWAIILGNYRFGPGDEDSKALSRMAQICHRAGAPFLAEASPRLLGCASLASSPHPREWQAPGAIGELVGTQAFGRRGRGWAGLAAVLAASAVREENPAVRVVRLRRNVGPAGPRRLLMGKSGVCGRAGASPVVQRCRMGDAAGDGGTDRETAHSRLPEGWRAGVEALCGGVADRRGRGSHVGRRTDAAGFVQEPGLGPDCEVSVNRRFRRRRWPGAGANNQDFK